MSYRMDGTAAARLHIIRRNLAEGRSVEYGDQVFLVSLISELTDALVAAGAIGWEDERA